MTRNQVELTTSSVRESAPDPPPAGTGAHLTFNVPLSDHRAGELVSHLTGAAPATVLDIGCGWAELLLRVLEDLPEARGTGIDPHRPDIERGRRAAAELGLADRADLRCGPAGAELTPADVVLNLGAFHAYGSTAEALRALRSLVRPGGLVLFGAEFWQRVPTTDEIAAMWEGASVQDCTDLAGLVEQATAAGFRPARVCTASTQEWEEYEAGHLAEREIWLAAHPDHHAARDVRRALDDSWSGWLRGHRDVMGFAYLTLLPVAGSAGLDRAGSR